MSNLMRAIKYVISGTTKPNERTDRTIGNSAKKDWMLTIAAILIIIQLFVFFFGTAMIWFSWWSYMSSAFAFIFFPPFGIIGLIYSLLLRKKGRGGVLATKLLLTISVGMATIFPAMLVMFLFLFFLEIGGDLLWYLTL